MWLNPISNLMLSLYNIKYKLGSVDTCVKLNTLAPKITLCRRIKSIQPILYTKLQKFRHSSVFVLRVMLTCVLRGHVLSINFIPLMVRIY